MDHGGGVPGESAGDAGLALMAVVVGIGTVLADDPMLNCRIVDREVRQPVRIIVDSNARVPLSSKIVRTATVYRDCRGSYPICKGRTIAAIERVWCGDFVV